MLPDAHAGCARPAVLPGRSLLMRRRIAAHLCSRSVIWALRKAMPTLEAVKFENKPASDVLRARFFVGIKSDINISSPPWSMQSGRDRPAVDSTLHILYIPKSSFSGEISAIRLGPICVSEWSSRRWLGAKLKLFAKLIVQSHRLQRALTPGPIPRLFCDR